MINQFVLTAGCAADQAKQLLQAAHWQFEVKKIIIKRRRRNRNIRMIKALTLARVDRVTLATRLMFMSDRPLG